MAQFQLLAPCILNTARGPGQFDAGTIIDSESFVNFQCNTQMEPLDDSAIQMMLVEFNRLVKTVGSFPYGGAPTYQLGGEIVGAGPVSVLRNRALGWGFDLT